MRKRRGILSFVFLLLDQVHRLDESVEHTSTHTHTTPHTQTRTNTTHTHKTHTTPPNLRPKTRVYTHTTTPTLSISLDLFHSQALSLWWYSRWWWREERARSGWQKRNKMTQADIGVGQNDNGGEGWYLSNCHVSQKARHNQTCKPSQADRQRHTHRAEAGRDRTTHTTRIG